MKIGTTNCTHTYIYIQYLDVLVRGSMMTEQDTTLHICSKAVLKLSLVVYIYKYICIVGYSWL